MFFQSLSIVLGFTLIPLITFLILARRDINKLKEKNVRLVKEVASLRSIVSDLRLKQPK